MIKYPLKQITLGYQIVNVRNALITFFLSIDVL
jgi:hypothetical protein